MENFIDVFLMLLIVMIIVFTGGFIFLFIKDPMAGYWVLWSGIAIILTGIGLGSWKFYQKKRLGTYQETLKELIQLHKEIVQTTRHLEPSVKKSIRSYFPKIRQLQGEAKKRIYKILDIEKDLHKIEKQQFTDEISTFRQIITPRYQNNIKMIEYAKSQYLRDIQQILRFFHEMNAQVLALKYANEKTDIQSKIAGMIDELLIDMRTLEEITYNFPE